jgi:nitrite reductase/ring-hydroxylating ferredoxin subunit
MTSRPSRRTFLTTIGAATAWLVTASASDALASAPGIAKGDPCKKAGRERKVGNKTFVCTERNGNLRWQPKKVEAVQTLTTVRVLDATALAVGASRVVNVSDPRGGTSGVVVTRTSNGVSAFRVNCTHAGYPVERRGAVLECDLHGSKFDPATGEVLNGPATRALARYSAREADGGIFVTVTS